MKQLSFYCLSFLLLPTLFGCGVIDALKPAVKIACVGTSVTQGYVLPDEKTYPYKLQALINSKGDNTDKVLNYGIGGTTILKKGDKPYWLEEKFTYLKQWKPTIMIIEFGTNDSKNQNWARRSEFKSDYVAFIKLFQTQGNNPKIYICLPTPAFSENFDVKPDVIRDEVTPLIQEIAKETNVEVIDFYKPMAGKSDLFIDGVHPTAEGATVLADEVYKVIAPK
jgi:lysophospholipase L1-like esterase